MPPFASGPFTFMPNGTIGNFTPEKRREFRLCRVLGEGGPEWTETLGSGTGCSAVATRCYRLATFCLRSSDGFGGRCTRITKNATEPEFLGGVRARLRRDDHVLVCMDLVKDPGVTEAAYSDAAGVTGRFNKNMPAIINERLGARFDPGLFSHRAFYDAETERVEMWLDVRRDVDLELLDLHTDERDLFALALGTPA